MTWSPTEFEAQLRQVGEERYHHRHPFNLRMHEGRPIWRCPECDRSYEAAEGGLRERGGTST